MRWTASARRSPVPASGGEAVLTYRTGVRTGLAAGRAMAAHLSEPTLDPERMRLAAYYGGMSVAVDGATPAILRSDLNSRLARLLGLDPARPPTEDELAHLLSGARADGAPIDGKRLYKFTDRASIAYLDCTLSADKSVSLAMAFAATDAERAMIVCAHREAVAATMRAIEGEIARARKGKAGSGGYDAGSMMWLEFVHYTSRPTIEIVKCDLVTGCDYTETVTVKTAGDPQLHSHVMIPNVVMTSSGKIGGLFLQRLSGRVHEYGAIYQAYLAKNLRALGIPIKLDPVTGAACIIAVPETVREAFSKRTAGGLAAARARAVEAGLDWDTIEPNHRIILVKGATQGDKKAPKKDDLGNWKAWRTEAAALGWRPESFVEPRHPIVSRDGDARLAHAAEVAAGLLDGALTRKAVIEASTIRTMAARGLVEAGIDDAAEVAAVVDRLVFGGVLQGGTRTTLLPVPGRDQDGAVLRYSTALHLQDESEAIALARAAAADTSDALPSAAIDSAVARSGLDLTGPHGAQQLRAMDALAGGGRLSVVTGAAGSGKTATLQPLVDAWTERGRPVFGVALAWRQASDLTATGIPGERVSALAPFLASADRGDVTLTPETVVVIDEIGLVGTRALLDLLRLQVRFGFRLALLGDPLQASSIDAGPTVDLLRHALGDEAVASITSTVRQSTAAERALTTAVREGHVGEVIDAKRNNGTAVLATGTPEQVAATIADRWQAMRAAAPGQSISISAPTNAECRLIATAIREKRRDAGEIIGSEVEIDATDNSKSKYKIKIAIGDKIRLYRRTNAHCDDGKRGIIGVNGSILTVISFDKSGIRLKNKNGRIGNVAWNTFRDEQGQIMLSYGDVITIDSAQGLTSDFHIAAFPTGTASIDAARAYVALSRHRHAVTTIIADAPVRRAIKNRRPLGDNRPITENMVWDQLSKDFTRRAVETTATIALAAAEKTKSSANMALRIGCHHMEKLPEDSSKGFRRRLHCMRTKNLISKIADQLQNLVHRSSVVVASFEKLSMEENADRTLAPVSGPVFVSRPMRRSGIYRNAAPRLR